MAKISKKEQENANLRETLKKLSNNLQANQAKLDKAYDLRKQRTEVDERVESINKRYYNALL